MRQFKPFPFEERKKRKFCATQVEQVRFTHRALSKHQVFFSSYDFTRIQRNNIKSVAYMICCCCCYFLFHSFLQEKDLKTVKTIVAQFQYENWFFNSYCPFFCECVRSIYRKADNLLYQKVHCITQPDTKRIIFRAFSFS